MNCRFILKTRLDFLFQQVFSGGWAVPLFTQHGWSTMCWPHSRVLPAFTELLPVWGWACCSTARKLFYISFISVCPSVSCSIVFFLGMWQWWSATIHTLYTHTINVCVTLCMCVQFECAFINSICVFSWTQERCLSVSATSESEVFKPSSRMDELFWFSSWVLEPATGDGYRSN